MGCMIMYIYGLHVFQILVCVSLISWANYIGFAELP